MLQPQAPLRIAVVGAGVSGLSAAWLLSQRHEVTLFEAEPRLGGHSCTVEAQTDDGATPVDIGFIVYNETTYPNFTAMLRHLDVETRAAFMSFAVSMDGGALEYSTHGLNALFAQRRNAFSPRFWSMLADLLRFQQSAPKDLPRLEGSLAGIDDYLAENGYGAPFRDLHLLPQMAAIWSSSLEQMGAFPAASLIRFYLNHQLLKIDLRPTWRTVVGGSRAYVERLEAGFLGQAELGRPVTGLRRTPAGCRLRFADGTAELFDRVVLAVHADQALRLLDDPTTDERRLLGAIPYRPNRVVLHRDARLMPRRRTAWAAWNHLGSAARAGEGGVTYWMNRLQDLPGPDVFVSLNPVEAPRPESVILERRFDHPVFSASAMAAQRELWSLQGVGGAWFCGAWFGWGFHEDGLQAGLAVAEQLGGVRRPWSVSDESGRIPLGPAPVPKAARAVA